MAEPKVVWFGSKGALLFQAGKLLNGRPHEQLLRALAKYLVDHGLLPEPNPKRPDVEAFKAKPLSGAVIGNALARHMQLPPKLFALLEDHASDVFTITKDAGAGRVELNMHTLCSSYAFAAALHRHQQVYGHHHNAAESSNPDSDCTAAVEEQDIEGARLRIFHHLCQTYGTALPPAVQQLFHNVLWYLMMHGLSGSPTSLPYIWGGIKWTWQECEWTEVAVSLSTSVKQNVANAGYAKPLHAIEELMTDLFFIQPPPAKRMQGTQVFITLHKNGFMEAVKAVARKGRPSEQGDPGGGPASAAATTLMEEGALAPSAAAAGHPAIIHLHPASSPVSFRHLALQTPLQQVSLGVLMSAGGAPIPPPDYMTDLPVYQLSQLEALLVYIMQPIHTCYVLDAQALRSFSPAEGGWLYHELATLLSDQQVIKVVHDSKRCYQLLPPDMREYLGNMTVDTRVLAELTWVFDNALAAGQHVSKDSMQVEQLLVSKRLWREAPVTTVLPLQPEAPTAWATRPLDDAALHLAARQLALLPALAGSLQRQLAKAASGPLALYASLNFSRGLRMLPDC